MSMIEIISRKQSGSELDTEQIREFISEYTEGRIPDYQASALLMAIYYQGMSVRETVDLTRAMIDSGKRTQHAKIQGIKVDKHSTGGVGDKTSLLIAPIVSSLGVPVPMISGRGLGHTGGTLDKLESIPGFTTALTYKEFERQVEEIGCALIGQTSEIVPADQKLYALRDVTCTVKSIPLVTASILSKKGAEGANALLLDVKFGRGAFFTELDSTRELANSIVTIGSELGLKVVALLTDMNQPLGSAIGNWLETRECIQIMQGNCYPDDLVQLTLAESAMMLLMAAKAADYEEGYHLAEEALKSGKSYDKFIEIARRQKADSRYIEDTTLYPKSHIREVIEADQDGYVHQLDALALGKSAVTLGAGRLKKEDTLDYSAGFIVHKKIGDKVTSGEPLITMFASSYKKIEAVTQVVSDAFKIQADSPTIMPLINSSISSQGETPWNP